MKAKLQGHARHQDERFATNLKGSVEIKEGKGIPKVIDNPWRKSKPRRQSMDINITKYHTPQGVNVSILSARLVDCRWSQWRTS
jgi:hypothetical protein